MSVLLPLALLFQPAPQVKPLPLPRKPAAAPTAVPAAPVKRRVLMKMPPLETSARVPLASLPLAKVLDGPKPLPSPTARPLPGAFKTPEELRRRMARAEAVKKCLAKSGRWEVAINLQHVTVSGSDTDEIYGQIGFKVDTVPLTLKRNPDDLGYSGWWLYYDDKNVDFSKNPETTYGPANASGIPLDRGRGETVANVGVFFNLWDEDGPRGGDDDWFFVDTYTGNVIDFWKNGQNTRVRLPSCEDEPTFQRETRFQISAHQYDRKWRNGILTTIRLRYYRT